MTLYTPKIHCVVITVIAVIFAVVITVQVMDAAHQEYLVELKQRNWASTASCDDLWLYLEHDMKNSILWDVYRDECRSDWQILKDERLEKIKQDMMMK